MTMQMLTLSDLPDFASNGGDIELHAEPGIRTHLLINRGQARQHGIDFSAQLLRFALKVIEP